MVVEAEAEGRQLDRKDLWGPNGAVGIGNGWECTDHTSKAAHIANQAAAAVAGKGCNTDDTEHTHEEARTKDHRVRPEERRT